MPICSCVDLRAPPPPAGPLVNSASTSSPISAAVCAVGRAAGDAQPHLVGPIVVARHRPRVQRAHARRCRRAAPGTARAAAPLTISPPSCARATQFSPRVARSRPRRCSPRDSRRSPSAYRAACGRARRETAIVSGAVSVISTAEKSAVTSGVRYGERIGHLVEQLLGRRHAVDHAAGALDLGEPRIAVRIHVGERKAEASPCRTRPSCPDRRSSRR